MPCSWSGGCGKRQGREVRWGGRNEAFILAFLGGFFFPTFLGSGVDCRTTIPTSHEEIHFVCMKRPPKESPPRGHLSVCINNTRKDFIFRISIISVPTIIAGLPLIPSNSTLSHSLGSRVYQTVLPTLVWQPVGSARVVWLIFLKRHPRIQTCGIVCQGAHNGAMAKGRVCTQTAVK